MTLFVQIAVSALAQCNIYREGKSYPFVRRLDRRRLEKKRIVLSPAQKDWLKNLLHRYRAQLPEMAAMIFVVEEYCRVHRIRKVHIDRGCLMGWRPKAKAFEPIDLEEVKAWQCQQEAERQELEKGFKQLTLQLA
ncbi:MAG: hypothetical protein AAFY20_07420 [Cyanobacteria bacterium J06639_14]